MLKRIREQFGTAGLIVAIVAMVVAVAGTAIAAGGLTKSQEKQVAKIAKKVGKPGAPGAAGATGPVGPAGKDGANGTNGKDGISPVGTGFSGKANGCEEGGVKFVGVNTTIACNGLKGGNGTPGTNGKSVVTGTEATGTGNCEGRGGSTVEVEGEPATKQFACSGKEGSPWTAGGTLPVGATETGTWYVTGTTGGSPGVFYAPLSFPIPLASNVKTGHFFFGTGAESEIEVSPGVFEKTEFQKHCPAVSFVGPTAANAGELCLYLDETDNTTGAVFEGVRRIVASATSGANRAGGLLELKFPENVSGFVTGSFAVKGCSTTLPVGDPNKCP